jgi:hypothetical protein
MAASSRLKTSMVFIGLKTNVWLKRLAWERDQRLAELYEDILEAAAKEFAGARWDDPITDPRDVKYHGWRA